MKIMSSVIHKTADCKSAEASWRRYILI